MGISVISEKENCHREMFIPVESLGFTPYNVAAQSVPSPLHYRITCIRQDSLHKLTSDLTNRYRRIVIEDLHVKGMLKNHCLAGSIILEKAVDILYSVSILPALMRYCFYRWFCSNDTPKVAGLLREPLWNKDG